MNSSCCGRMREREKENKRENQTERKKERKNRERQIENERERKREQARQKERDTRTCSQVLVLSCVPSFFSLSVSVSLMKECLAQHGNEPLHRHA